MYRLLDGIINLPAPFNMVVYIIMIVMGAGIITGITKQVRKMVCHRQDLDFKREMLDRGLTAEEIDQVIRSKSPSHK